MDLQGKEHQGPEVPSVILSSTTTPSSPKYIWIYSSIFEYLKPFARNKQLHDNQKVSYLPAQTHVNQQNLVRVHQCMTKPTNMEMLRFEGKPTFYGVIIGFVPQTSSGCSFFFDFARGVERAEVLGHATTHNP